MSMVKDISGDKLEACDLIKFIDLTSLNSDDRQLDIQILCQQAMTCFGGVAAVCVFPQYVSFAVNYLKAKPVSVATVANFPRGTDALTDVLTEVESALAEGADEIDVVLPYQEYLAGNQKSALGLIQSCRQICEGKTLKVIVETGAFPDQETIYDASCRILEMGADFLKTSTGKIAQGATLESAATFLKAINNVNKNAGFKASGGIKMIEQGMSYFNLAIEKMGVAWCTPKHFRLGASSLLNAILRLEGS